MTNSTTRLGFVLSALILAGPTALQAQKADPMNVTCAEMMAMDAAAQKAFLQRLVAASANAADSADGTSLNDLVANDASIGRLSTVCKDNPSMMVMDAARSMTN